MSFLRPADLASLPPGQRHDRLRRALRAETGGTEIDAPTLDADLPGWLTLLRASTDPALTVLLLELLDRIGSCPPLLATLEKLRRSRSDSVRLEALRQLLGRQPERAIELAGAHLDDPALEVRLLAARTLYSHDPHAARAALGRAIEDESLGPREMHALERVTEFLVEEIGDPACIPLIESFRESCRDEEGFIDWAVQRLRDEC